MSNNLSSQIINELSAIAYANFADVANFENSVWRLKPFNEIPLEKLAAIKEISSSKGKITVKFHDKQQALKLLGKIKSNK
jgi:hypothetical protein